MLYDRVYFATSTTGTGTITAGAAEVGFRTMATANNGSTIPNGTEVEYAIVDGTAFETGTGTVNSSGTTLSRTISQSSTNALLNLSGSAKVFLTRIAARDGSIAAGGTGATTAAAALTSLGAYPAINPSGYTSNTGTVTSVAGTGTVNGITLTGTITTSGSLTLGGTLSGVSLSTQVTGTLPVANGGSGVTTSTGTVANVLSNSPTLVTPILGAASATSIANGLGAVATPSYTFTGDTNTGMWSPAADTIAFSKGGAEAVRIDSSGFLLVGTTTPMGGNTSNEYKNTASGSWPLTINANDRGVLVRNSASVSGFYAYFEYNGGTNNGSIAWAAGVTSYNTTSDARIKFNIVDAPNAGSIIDQIKVRSWDFTADGNHWRYGMVAQELLESFPEAVSVPSDKTMMMGVDYSKIVPLLIKEVQSLRIRIAVLENMR